ncbi:Kinesin-like protein KIF15 [Hondaea fermentalgiana]|uniref:Kinesin-like protein KIF15 n=1 Tax=Hondaea fermentalgiana TaxID=2315210 RepID=A0A2R5GSA1_9STRA|nr:Kinesin-like protein KIF15 [Hondaea fermentalgiana]|eukprot:GBG30754.1 Kinesin-like protein KIF15 [Hondaea fermentalgiana]
MPRPSSRGSMSSTTSASKPPPRSATKYRTPQKYKTWNPRSAGKGSTPSGLSSAWKLDRTAALRRSSSVSSVGSARRMPPGEGPSVRVMVRVRPSDERDNCVEVLERPDDDETESKSDMDSVDGNVGKPKRASIRVGGAGGQMFTFDRVFHGEEDQEAVFRDAGRPIADSALKGYNASIFAYGQTGSGKTFTMQGMKNSRGLIPRMLEYCFVNLERLKAEGTAVVVHCSYLEIYNENVYDLLDFDSHAKSNQPGFVLPSKSVREDTRKGVFVENAVEQSLGSVQDAFDLIARGTELRHVGATKMNRESSRSHSIFTLSIEIKSLADEATGTMEITRNSRINLVDLAGSERQRMTKSSGSRLNEAKHINKSLSALGNVISALVEQGKGRVFHIPHRDSVLTYLLRDSLGGNTRTSIIATISPDASNFQDTLSTLQFGQRAKRIRNVVKANTTMSSDVSVLQREVRRLRDELDRAKRLAAESVPDMITSGTDAPAAGGADDAGNVSPTLTTAETIEKQQQLLQEAREALTENADFQRVEANVLKREGFDAAEATGQQILRQRIAHLEEVLLQILKELAGGRDKAKLLGSEIRERIETEQVLRDDIEAKKLLLQLLEQKLKAAEAADPEWFQNEESVLREVKDTSSELVLQAQVAQVKAENASLATMLKTRTSSAEAHNIERRLCSMQMQLEAVLDDKKGLESIVKRLGDENKSLREELKRETERADANETSSSSRNVSFATNGLRSPSARGATTEDDQSFDSASQDLIVALEAELKQAIERADKLEQEVFLEMERKAEGDAERERIQRVLDSMRVKRSGSRRASTGNFTGAGESSRTYSTTETGSSGDDTTSSSPSAVSRAIVKVAAEAHRSARELTNAAARDDGKLVEENAQSTAETLVRQRLLTQLSDARKQLKESEKANRRLQVQLEREIIAARKQKQKLRKSISEKDTSLGTEQQRVVDREAKYQMLKEKHERTLCTNKELQEAVEMANSFADYKTKQLESALKELELFKQKQAMVTRTPNRLTDDFGAHHKRGSTSSSMTKQSRDSSQTVRLSTFEDDATTQRTTRKSSMSVLGITPRSSSASDSDSQIPAPGIRRSSSFNPDRESIALTPKRSVAEFFPMSTEATPVPPTPPASTDAAGSATPQIAASATPRQPPKSAVPTSASSSVAKLGRSGRRRSSGILTPKSLRERARGVNAENDRQSSNLGSGAKATPTPSSSSSSSSSSSATSSGSKKTPNANQTPPTSAFRFANLLRFSSSR